MYTRSTPLWAQTYHLFQTSRHGKYRYVPLKSIVPTEQHPISSILRDFQSDEPVENHKDFDSWLKDMMGGDPEGNENVVNKAIDEIENYIDSLDDAHEYKIITKRTKTGSRKKQLHKIVEYARGILTKEIDKVQKKRQEKADKLLKEQQAMESLRADIARTISIIDKKAFEYISKKKRLYKKITIENGDDGTEVIVTKRDLSHKALKKLLSEVEDIHLHEKDILDIIKNDAEEKIKVDEEKKRKKEKELRDLKHQICKLFQQLPDILISIKNLTVSDLDKLGKKALQNRLKQYTEYLEDGKANEIIAQWKIDEKKKIKEREEKEKERKRIEETKKKRMEKERERRLEVEKNEKDNLIKNIKEKYKIIDDNVLRYKKIWMKNINNIDKLSLNKLKEKYDKIIRVYNRRYDFEDELQKLKDQKSAQKREKEEEVKRQLKEERRERMEQDISLSRDAAIAEYQNQRLPICTELFANDDGPYKLFKTGDYTYYMTERDKGKEILSLQLGNANVLNSVVVYETELAAAPGTEAGPNHKLNNRFIVENNRFLGASCDDVNVVQDILIPDNNLPTVNGGMLNADQMKNKIEKRLNIRGYTKTKWYQNKNKQGERAELKPDDIQLKVLVANPRDVLIAHKPGEGKTANAILLAEMKRNIILRKKQFVPPRILVITPNAPILLQWQQQVIKWGFDPSHWIFQTVAHFRKSQQEKEYPNWEDLSDNMQEIYRNKIWDDPEHPFIEFDASRTSMQTYNNEELDVGQAFDPPIEGKLSRQQIRTKLKKSLLDILNYKWLHNLNIESIRWNKVPVDENVVSKYFLKKKKTISKCHYMATTDKIDFDALHEYRDHIIVYKDGGTIHILSDLELETNPENVNEFGCPNITRNFDYKEMLKRTAIQTELRGKLSGVSSILEIKNALKKHHFENGIAYPNINNVDKFINTNHGTSLVQHRYCAPDNTIFIIDECHKVLSGDANEKVKVQTEAVFAYGEKSISNILVSATPWLSSDYINSMKITAQFLSRNWDRDIGEIERRIDNDGNIIPITKSQKDEAIADIYNALYGKITRAVYEDEIVLLKERLDSMKYFARPERFLKRMLYGNNINWSKYRNVELIGLKLEKKKLLINSTFMSLGAKKMNTRENPFPAKIPLGDGFKSVETDVLRKEIMINDPIEMINPDMAYKINDVRGTDSEKCLIFHEEASRSLRDKYVDKHPYFFPVIVSIKCENENETKIDQETNLRYLSKLQKYAYSVTNKWIVVLHVTDNDSNSIEQALRKINVKNYVAPPNFDERAPSFRAGRGGSGWASIDAYLDVDVEPSDVQWLQLKDGLTHANVHGIVSSKVDQIVIMIEEAVIANKNVLVYDNSIELLLAIQQGLEIRKNKRLKLNDYQKGKYLMRMIKHKKKKWERWSLEDRKNDIAAVKKICSIKENDDDIVANLKQDIYHIVENHFSYNNGQRFGDVIITDKYTHVKKMSEQGRPIFMKPLKTESFTSNDDGLWELKDNTLVVCTGKPKGYAPVTRKEYVRFQLKEWRKLYDLSKYFKPISTEIGILFAKQGAKKNPNKVMQAYELFFNGLADLYGKDAYKLAHIAKIMQFKLNVKYVKTRKEKFISTMQDMSTSISDFTYIKRGSESLESVGNDFLQLVKLYLKYQLDEIGISKNQQEPYWTKTLREKATTIFDPFLSVYFYNDIEYRKEDLPSYAAKLKGDYYKELKRPSNVPRNMKIALMGIAREIDESCVPFVEHAREFGGRYYANDDLKNDRNLRQWDAKNFIEYVDYLYEMNSEKRKEEILHQFGYTFTDSDRSLHLSPHEKEFLEYHIKEQIKWEENGDPKVLLLYDEIKDQETLLDTWSNKWLDETKTGMNHKDHDYKQAYGFIHENKPIDALGMIGLQNISSRYFKSQLKVKLRDAYNDNKSILFSQLPKDVQKSLYNATHNNVKIKKHVQELKRIKKEVKELERTNIKMLQKRKNPTKDFPDRPKQEAMNRMRELIDTQERWNIDREDPIYISIQKKFEEFDSRREHSPLNMTTMNYETVVELLEEFEELNVDLNHAFSINDWEWLNITTYLNSWKYSTQGGTGIYTGSGAKVTKTTPEAAPHQRPYPIDTIDKQHQLFNGNYPVDANGSDLGYSKDFSYLRYTTTNETYRAIINRIKGMIEDKVVFGILSGVHTPTPAERNTYKIAFECGVIDCLLMNSSVREGIDYSSLSSSLCICIEPQKIPDVENQFVGRLVRKHSHDVCPKPFRRVEYVSFENVCNDKVLEVNEYKEKYSASDIVAAATPSEMKMYVGMTSAWDETHGDTGGRRARSRNDPSLIKRILAKFPEWDVAKTKKAIDEINKKYRKKQLTPDEIYRQVTNMGNAENLLTRKKEEYTGASLPDDEALIDNTISKMEYIANRAVRNISTYLNISSVIKYKNHVFYRPYDLLKCDFTYEYGARENKNGGENITTVQYGWCCPLCNFESDNITKPERCQNCYAPLGDYHKMEPYYIDDDIVFDVDYETDDTFKRKTYQKIYKELDIVSADLLPLQIEHTAKCRKDMVMKFTALDSDDRINFYQRIQNGEDKVANATNYADSRFQLVDADFDVEESYEEEVDSEEDPVKEEESKDEDMPDISSDGSTETEEDTDDVELQSEYDSDEDEEPPAKRQKSNKRVLIISDDDDDDYSSAEEGEKSDTQEDETKEE